MRKTDRGWLIHERDTARREVLRKQEQIEKLVTSLFKAERSISALRGVITKLKKARR